MSVMTFLFIPVSSTEGIGEYTRSLIIAECIAKKWPFIKIYFALNKHAPYMDSCPFEVIPTEQSATKDSNKIDATLDKIKPNFVLFDASGRAKSFRKAKEVGAKVAFISQHEKKRARGLKLNRLMNLDKHWVVQPSFSIEPLNYYQRCKLTLLAKHEPKNIGPVFDDAIDTKKTNVIRDYNLPLEFFVFNSGSGGHKKSNQYCIEKVYQAAKTFSVESGMHCVVVLGDNYPKKLSSTENITCIKGLENSDFIQLLMLAKGRLVSAGDTILQCVALLLPSVVIAVSSDQPKRLGSCVNHKLVLGSEFNKESMVKSCHQLLLPSTYKELQNTMIKHQTDDALSIIVNDIASLVNLTVDH